MSVRSVLTVVTTETVVVSFLPETESRRRQEGSRSRRPSRFGLRCTLAGVKRE